MRPLCQRLQHPLSNDETSNGCRDARSSVRCVKGYSVEVLTGTDARPCVPTTVTRPVVRGRTHDRASLQPLLVPSFGDGRTTVRPYSRYSSRFDEDGRTIERPYNRYSSRRSGTDARPSVPTTVTRLALTGTDALPLDTSVHPYSRYSYQGTPTHAEDSDTTPPRKSKLPRWKMGIPHGGIKKFIGTLICFFRSFISFFRTFISRLREEFSFAR